MKSLVALLVLALAAVTLAEDAKYTTKYDDIDLDQILSNERLYKQYFKCLLGTHSCTQDGTELKNALPDALLNNCLKCSEKQKYGSEKVIKFIIDNKPEDYKELEKIYDPEGTYKKKYYDDAKKAGINL